MENIFHPFSNLSLLITVLNSLDMLILNSRSAAKKKGRLYTYRPYHSCDRASNENCNGLIRRFIKKGTDINTVDIAVSRSINRQINNKKRKILGYISAEQSFLHELTNIGFCDDSCFYVNLLSYFHFLLAIQDSKKTVLPIYEKHCLYSVISFPYLNILSQMSKYLPYSAVQMEQLVWLPCHPLSFHMLLMISASYTPYWDLHP